MEITLNVNGNNTSASVTKSNLSVMGYTVSKTRLEKLNEAIKNFGDSRKERVILKSTKSLPYEVKIANRKVSVAGHTIPLNNIAKVLKAMSGVGSKS